MRIKNFLTKAIATVLLICTISATAVFANENQNIYGDCNGDRVVDSVDATLLLQHYADINTLPSDMQKWADVNADSSIDSSDATMILQRYAELVSKFPAEEIVTPTEPTEPTEATEPTEVTIPTEPTEPTEVTLPTEPTEATEVTIPTEPTEATGATIPTEPTEVIEIPEISKAVYTSYQQLDDTEKAAYDTIVEQITYTNGTIQVEFNVSDNGASFANVLHAIYYDHSEFFWFNGGFSYSYSPYKNITYLTLRTYEYWDTVTDKEGAYNTFMAKVDEVCDLAQKYTTDYEKALFVHNYIAGKTAYVIDGSDDIYSAYGILANNEGVCDGYAKAYQLILQRLGIICGRAVGTASGGNHAWNYIMLDDEYYFVDLTWDDTMGGTYYYFCITSEELARTHTLSGNSFTVPTCTATKYNYYTYNGYTLDTYSIDGVKSVFAKQSGNDKLMVKFTSAQEYQNALTGLFSKGELYKVSDTLRGNISYSRSDDFYVITIITNVSNVA